MINITTEDMIRFLYNEMTQEESRHFLQAIESDWSLKESFEQLKQSRDSLNTPLVSPRKSTVNAIMQYAGLSESVAH